LNLSYKLNLTLIEILLFARSYYQCFANMPRRNLYLVVMGIFATSEKNAIIRLMVDNGLKDIYMEKETPDGQTILKVTLMPFQGFTYQKNDKVFTSDDYDRYVDLTIIYLELQKQIREFRLG